MIIIFGCGSSGNELLKKEKIKANFFTDNDKRTWGKKINGISVISPYKLKNLKVSKVFIAVPAIEQIKEQLKSYRIQKNKIFISKFLVENKIPKLNKDILITANGKNGGIYKYFSKDNKLKKVFSGSVRGIIKINKTYVCVDENEGLLKLSYKFKIVKKLKIEKLSNPHGVTYDSRNKKIYLLLTSNDAIAKISLSKFAIEKIYNFKKNNEKIDLHHLNSITYFKKHLYLTMFSTKGNWRKNIWTNGALVKVKSLEQKRFKIVKSGLEQPHSAIYFNKDFYFCNSKTFQVMSLKKKFVLNFNGYTRGLLIDKDFFIVGISKTRRFHNFNKKLEYMSLDSGFHIINKKFKTQNFIKLPTIDIFDIIFA